MFQLIFDLELVSFKKTMIGQLFAVGQVVQFEYTFTNSHKTGSIQFDELTDDMVEVSSCTMPVTVNAGRSASCIVDYTVQANDITMVNNQPVLVSPASVLLPSGAVLKWVLRQKWTRQLLL